MKRVLCGLLACTMMVTFAACGGDSAKTTGDNTSALTSASLPGSADTSEPVQAEADYHGVTFDIPSEWESRRGDDNWCYYYPDGQADPIMSMLSVDYLDMDMTDENVIDTLNEYADGWSETDGITDFKKKNCKIDGVNSLMATYQMEVDGIKRFNYSYFIPVGSDGIFTISFTAKNEERIKDYKKVLDSVKVPVSPDEGDNDEESVSTIEESSNTDNSSESSEESLTEEESLSVERSSALDKAESYLSFTAFSHDGLVKQLEYEKFSHEDAVYAADHCGADWNEQAAKKAKSYREITSFSHAGLVEQLKYEGFTAEQAEYGASATE